MPHSGATAPLSKHHLKLWRMINRYVRCYGAFRCNLGHKAMMRETGKKLRTVGRYLADLKAGGFIAIQFRPNKTSLYNVLADPHGRSNFKMADPFGRSNGRSYKEELKTELQMERLHPCQTLTPEAAAEQEEWNCAYEARFPAAWSGEGCADTPRKPAASQGAQDSRREGVL